MGSRQIEIETTYAATATDAVPDLREVPGVSGIEAPEVHQLEATYFDTEGLALAQRGITLRRRTGGVDAGWHAKLPKSTSVRTEVHEPLGDDLFAPPSALVDAVRVHVRDHDLQPIVRLTTQRTVHRLLGDEGVARAELCDDRVTAVVLLDAEPEALVWREWEVEVVDGDERLLRTITKHLRRSGIHPSDQQSKLLRVLGTRVPATYRRPSRFTAKDPSIQVVMAYVAEQVAALTVQDPRVRADEPDAVHRMRVATRRLRSTLATYRPVLDREVTDPVRTELAWLAGELGKARDAEVMSQRLHAMVDGQEPELVLGAVGRRLAGDLRGRYVLAHSRVVEALDSERYFRVLDRLDELLLAPPATARATDPAGRLLPKLIAHDWRRVRRARARAGARGEWTDQQLHEIRKTLKRLRYAAESAEVVAGRKAARLAKAAKQTQQPLGDRQDGVLARELLRQIGVQAHLDGDNGFTYGRLHALEEARATALETAFEVAYDDLAGRPIRRWVG